MISCGKECVCCDYPIHMDTYRGCEHGCLYCRARNKYAIGKVTPMNNIKQLRNLTESGTQKQSGVIGTSRCNGARIVTRFSRVSVRSVLLWNA
jgi:DNA repair photolyase